MLPPPITKLLFPPSTALPYLAAHPTKETAKAKDPIMKHGLSATITIAIMVLLLVALTPTTATAEENANLRGANDAEVVAVSASKDDWGAAAPADAPAAAPAAPDANAGESRHAFFVMEGWLSS